MAGSLAPKALATFSDVRFSELWAAIYRLALRPKGKSLERNLLDEDTLRHNQECIKQQLAKFLDFESDAPNRAILLRA